MSQADQTRYLGPFGLFALDPRLLDDPAPVAHLLVHEGTEFGWAAADGLQAHPGQLLLDCGVAQDGLDLAGYFKAKGVELPEPNFLNKVSLDFGVAHEDQHYHVPLLASPWSYSTYRGS